MFVCMYVLYAFRHCTSQCNQTLHGTPLGPGEGQDGVGGTEMGMGKVLPGAAKVGGGSVHPSNNRKFPVTVSKKDKIFLKILY